MATQSKTIEKLFRLNDMEDHIGTITISVTKKEPLFEMAFSFPDLYNDPIVLTFSEAYVDEIVDFQECTYVKFWKFSFMDGGPNHQSISLILNFERTPSDIRLHLSLSTKHGLHFETSILDDFESSFYRLAKEYPKDTIS